MVFFRNDYGEGCIQPIMDLLVKANEESNPGYGQDQYSKRAAELIQSKFPDTRGDIHFIVSGTLTNIVMIRHVLRPYEAVFCTDTAHIAVHEAGAVEASGHKMITLPNSNGKLTAAGIQRAIDRLVLDPNSFMVPKLVYVSNATELGTVYTRQELMDISEVCRKNNMYLMCDGARMGQALMSGIDYTLNDLAKWVDLFSIGGTKNGALFGEAVVVVNENLKPFFRYVQKQSGAILAKGWLIGMQFIGLFENDAFYQCARYSNELAAGIQAEAIRLGYPLFMKSTTNQVFLVLNKIQYEYLKEKVDFEIWTYWDENIVIRLVTSWHTSKTAVSTLCQYLQLAMEASKPADQAEKEAVEPLEPGHENAAKKESEVSPSIA